MDPVSNPHHFNPPHSPPSTASSSSFHDFNDHQGPQTLSIELINPKRPSLHRTVLLVLTNHGILLNESEPSLLNSSCGWSGCLPFTDADQPEVCFSYQNILNCTLASPKTSHPFELATLTSTHPTRARTVRLKGFLTNPLEVDQAAAWVERVMSRAYDAQGVPRSRRLLVIVNPFGGSGQGQKIWSTTVEPILSASTASLQVHLTTHSGHAAEIGEQIEIERFDTVVCVSGDGVVHELINGLGRRADAGRALRMLTLASIPAGSGNALSVNHLGPKQSRNTVLAALTVLKGMPVPLDLCSVTQEGEKGEVVRRLSFLSTAFGLMADLDVGTEAWRWMGETRFMLGYLWGALANRRQRVRLDMQVSAQNKRTIEDRWRVVRAAPNMHCNTPDGDGLPPLRFADVRTPIVPGRDGWQTLEDDITSIYAGTLPFMAADLLEFPVKLPGDGSIDVIVHRSPNTYRTLKCIDGAAQGSMFKNEDCRYFKTKAFRLTPLHPNSSHPLLADENHTEKLKPRSASDLLSSSSSQISDVHDQARNGNGKSYIVLDGEEMPYKSIQVEIHDRLAKVLSLKGRRLGTDGVPDKFL